MYPENSGVQMGTHTSFVGILEWHHLIGLEIIWISNLDREVDSCVGILDVGVASFD